MEIGVQLDADRTGAEELVALARAAEDQGIGFAVVTGRRREGSGPCRSGRRSGS